LSSPQCTPSAVAHLCQSRNVSALFHDEAYEDLARSASEAATTDLESRPLPWQEQGLNIRDAINESTRTTPNQKNVPAKNDVAFLFHTSGTSTGLPKAIPQTHHAATGVLPSLDGKLHATFTTTPLYHGGIADCLRSWTSSALIWLFPGADVPITSKNILASIACAHRVMKQGVPPVSYFASVPYILQMLAEESSGLEMLINMDLVSVGGAALPQHIGDELVDQGVNLVSRFGSAECGFLLSSHRLYEQDKEWQYLRLPANNSHLHFEPEANKKLSQLIVLPTWPHVAKTNRPDGSFATGDIFEPHTCIPNAWKYHSRNDSQITLNTGKKFDPAPLEDTISSSSPMIRDALIFGNGRNVPGVLVFPASSSDGRGIGNTIWGILRELNSQGQDHTRIVRNMVVIMPGETEPLPKSSKGTILRNIAYERFAKEIKEAYDEGGAVENVESLSKNLSESAILSAVQKIVLSVTGKQRSLTDESNLYHHGVDSAMCTQIRGRLQKSVGSEIVLTWSIVYDCGSIAA
jgi:acyl-coenzyme A synthetase/AMP-(fatty) acid ligase